MKWNTLKDLKNQHIMARSKEKIWNKVIDVYKFGKDYKAISKALGILQIMVRVTNVEN